MSVEAATIFGIIFTALLLIVLMCLSHPSGKVQAIGLGIFIGVVGAACEANFATWMALR